ncbi:hypothetical protein GCM10008959_13190 [Deinococcus seoulensis]|uniref:Uncharacterized protein n=1 Tax=Deinococcus seoulensis TaxID=1837379 RepID=A0ABQ2RRM3_9DEIO|nr:hypothetical protein GCM10008959_13190 [Deinococcus seoulensis]
MLKREWRGSGAFPESRNVSFDVLKSTVEGIYGCQGSSGTFESCHLRIRRPGVRIPSGTPPQQSPRHAWVFRSCDPRRAAALAPHPTIPTCNFRLNPVASFGWATSARNKSASNT